MLNSSAEKEASQDRKEIFGNPLAGNAVSIGTHGVRRGFYRIRVRLLAVVLALPLISAHGQEYEIRLHRPVRAGDKFRTTVAAKEVQEMSVTVNGNPVKAEKKDFSVGFTGVVEILGTDAKGSATRISATVEKLMTNEAGSESEPAPKGEVIVVSVSGGKQVCQVSGMPAEDNITKAMNLAFSLSKSAVTDDDVFGTKQKRKAGESWSINAAVAKKDFAETYGLRVEDLNGKVTFGEVVNRADGDVLTLSAALNMKAVPPLPPEFVLDQSTAEARMDGEFPVDATRPRPAESMSMKMAVTAHGAAPDGGKILLTMRAEKLAREERTPLK